MTRDMALLILGLGPKDGTVEEVTAAFRQRTSLWHPDKHGGDPAKGEVMRAIVQAKQVLLGAEAADVAEEPALDMEAILEFLRESGLSPRTKKREAGDQCRAYTSKGDPCSRKPMKGNYGFCHLHRY